MTSRGEVYEGEFKNGVYCGNGVYYFSKQDAKMVGTFLDGKPNGECTIFFGRYVCTWYILRGNWITVFRGLQIVFILCEDNSQLTIIECTAKNLNNI